MKGLIFGAGSVGRGFIGELLFDSDMEICFVDVDEEIIDGINKENQYPHITVYNEDEDTKWIKNCKAISSLDEEAVIREIETADFMATSLGAKVLSIVAPMMAKGLASRLAKSGKGINVLLCENLYGVDEIMRDLLLEHFPDSQRKQFDQKIGLLATSIGRMIPVSSDETRKLHPAAIKVEPYKYLPYNGSAIKGFMPEISNLIWDPSVDFSFYVDRKLYVHNMGHTMTAYLAQNFDYEYIWQAIQDPKIRYFVRSAMIESAIALSKKYKQSLGELIAHVDHLIMRFGNRALKDTCERVGRDPVRKLKADDRLLGAYLTCIEENVPLSHISLGLAAGLLELEKDKDFHYANINSYLKKEAALLFKDKNKENLQLLEAQLKELREAFDFAIQTGLIDTYGPQDIV